MAGFGEFALFLAVGSAAWGLLAGLVSARRGRADLAASARGGLTAAALSLTAAAAALVLLLLGRDFSVIYVVEYTSRSMSWLYTLGAFWAGQAGSLLLWAWLAALCGMVAARPGRPATGRSYLVAALSGVVLLFAVLVAFTANPFDRMPAPAADGQGLNLMLQNWGQMVHPVALYLGLVTLTVPFAFAVSGLAAGARDEDWLKPASRWAAVSWIFLTAGIVLGMQWSYVELGWGGYWAWDPVENASLLPWLTLTALLHTGPLQRYRGMFRLINPVLVFASFALSLFGTFLTRSGVVSSVHAFAESAVGPVLLAGMVAVILVSGALIVWRLPALRGGQRLGSAWSADGSVVAGSLLLAVIAGVVLWGTVYPLTSKAFGGAESSVGPSFYLTLVAPLAIVLLAAAGAYPILRSWRQGGRGIPGEPLRAFGAGLLVAAGFGLLDHWRHPAAAGVTGLAAAVAVAVAESAARRLAGGGADWRQIGSALAHLGLAVFIAAVGINVSMRQAARATISIGQSATVGQYTVRLDALSTVSQGPKLATVARMSVTGAGGVALGTLASQQAITGTQQQAVAEVAIRSSATEDLYVALDGIEPSGEAATIDIYVNPAIVWIWVGAFLLVGGGVVAAIPGRLSIRAPPRRRSGRPSGVPGSGPDGAGDAGAAVAGSEVAA